jgi:hypothetical protein
MVIIYTHTTTHCLLAGGRIQRRHWRGTDRLQCGAHKPRRARARHSSMAERVSDQAKELEQSQHLEHIAAVFAAGQ